MLLADKTAAISGAASARGIGLATARLFAKHGARVAILDLDEAGARRAAEELGEGHIGVGCNVADLESCKRAARQVLDAFGKLDVLINNAGISLVDDLSDEAAIESHLSVNLFGPFRVTRAFLPQLTASRGALLNVLSLAALATVPITPAYAISKAAALSLTQSWRALLAADGVSVHAALPGPVDTDMIRGWEIPKATPADVARAILDGLAKGQEEIFPDAMSASVEPGWETGIVKTHERGNAAAIAAMGAA